MSRLRIAAAALAAAAVCSLAAPAHAGVHPSTVETVPVTVDSSNQSGWWNPVAVVGGTTYFAYNVPGSAANRHEVHLGARAADGTWTSGCLRDAAGACADFLDDNGHNQPSIVVDGEGSIHAFVSMHHEDWNYFRSTTPGDVTSLVDVSAEMPDAGSAVSYPVTAPGADGDAWLMVRIGADPQGRRDGVLYHYDLATHTWSRETVIASAVSHSFYPDDLEVDAAGRVHVLWEWGPWPADPYRHLGSYAVYDPAAHAFSDIAGAALPTPIRPDSPGSVVWRGYAPGETIGDAVPAVQTAKMAIEDGALVGVAYRYADETENDFDVHWATWNGSAWTDEKLIDAAGLGAGVATIATLDTTRHGSKTRVYAVVSVQDCGVTRSQAVLLESAEGSPDWAVEAVGDPVTGQQRLRAATREDGTDVLYLSAPATPGGGTLRYAEVPRDGQKRDGGSLSAIVSALRGDAGGENLARTGTATATSQLRADTGPEKAIDGGCTDASRWISALDDRQPALTIEWAEAAPLDIVRVRSGYSVGPAAASVLRDFTVELRTAAGWTPVAAIADNTSNTVVVDAQGLSADAVRLVITDPSDSTTDVARVYEVEAIAAP
ncbi:BNR-4 repeat-containing protein [Microbacterium hydrocarbonoxydans]|uniref:BNR-4 repeat-containing protein n=1 Tax=Microbacterium hydrocarbonoxydans TaxID=273678 RepID=UPI0013DABBD3|nr:BNR-4 repeat-containing protein [Microbacterium hydrocarbonoxydans]